MIPPKMSQANMYLLQPEAEQHWQDETCQVNFQCIPNDGNRCGAEVLPCCSQLVCRESPIFELCTPFIDWSSHWLLGVVWGCERHGHEAGNKQRKYAYVSKRSLSFGQRCCDRHSAVVAIDASSTRRRRHSYFIRLYMTSKCCQPIATMIASEDISARPGSTVGNGS